MTNRNKLPSSESHDHGPHGAGRSRLAGAGRPGSRQHSSASENSRRQSNSYTVAWMRENWQAPRLGFCLTPLAALQHLGHTTPQSKLGCRQRQAGTGTTRQCGERVRQVGHKPSCNNNAEGSELPHENSSPGSSPDRPTELPENG
jgi:hypothetical protein